MSIPRLRARTCLLDADLARSTVVELPADDGPGRVRSIGELLRSLLPVTLRPQDPEGPVARAPRQANVAD